MTYSDTYYGGKWRWYSDPPKDIAMRIGDDIKRAVCFLCVKLPDGSYHIGGTAFFLHTPYETDPTQQHLFVVTARHNIELARKAGYDALYLRINTLQGKADYYQVNRKWILPEPNDFWYTDVAVVLLDHTPRPFNYMALHLDFAASEDSIGSRGIGIGDELATIGLFKKREGHTKNIPILRSGTLAAMPEEPIPETIKNEQGEDEVKYYHAYLAEVRSIKGLSGSPVFVLLEEGRTIFTIAGTVRGYTENPEIYILGLIRGHWSIEDFEVAVDYADEGEDDRINTGIATVTPISEAMKIINGAEMMKQRQEKEKARVKHNSTTLDSSFPRTKPESTEGITQEGFENALRKVFPKPSESDLGKKET